MDPHPPKLNLKPHQCVRMPAPLWAEAEVPVDPTAPGPFGQAAPGKDRTGPKGQG